MERRQQMSSLATTSLSSNQQERPVSPQKPLTISTYTCTEPIEMQSVETLTEVRTNPFNYDPNSLFLNPIQNNCFCAGTILPPKKPPRITKCTTKSCTTTDVMSLPPIPERCMSPKKICNNQSSESSSDDNSMVGYLHQQHCSHHHTHTNATTNLTNYQHYYDQSFLSSNKTNIYPYLIKDNLGIEEKTTIIIDEPLTMTQQTNLCSTASYVMTTTTTIDAEFINSEFYIDESLPSSLNSDPQDDVSACYSSNSSRPPNNCSCSMTNDKIGDEKSLCGTIQRPQINDDAATIILLLQVQLFSSLFNK